MNNMETRWRSSIEDGYVNVMPPPPPPSYTPVDTSSSSFNSTGPRTYANLPGSRSFDRPASDTFTQVYYNELLRNARAAIANASGNNGNGNGGGQSAHEQQVLENAGIPAPTYGLSNTLPRRLNNNAESSSREGDRAGLASLPPTGLQGTTGTMTRRSLPASIRNLGKKNVFKM